MPAIEHASDVTSNGVRQGVGSVDADLPTPELFFEVVRAALDEHFRFVPGIGRDTCKPGHLHFCINRVIRFQTTPLVFLRPGRSQRL